MTFLGPIEALKFWSINSAYRRFEWGTLRREEEDAPGDAFDTRYVYHAPAHEDVNHG